jgi:outer membrane protein assembly factor BamB
MSKSFTIVFLLFSSAILGAETPKEELTRLQNVGREGRDNAAAARAWKAVVRRGPSLLPALLESLDGADAASANWLRTAGDAIVERALADKKTLPAEPFTQFIRQTRHNGAARRLAYEWLCRVDAKTPERLLPGMLQDPSPELRRDAVAVVLKQAQSDLDKGDKDAARAAYRRALTGACDKDQVERIAGQLDKLGVKIDVAAHFGFVRHWRIAAPFDNHQGVGFRAVYPPEKGVDVQAAYKGKDDKEARWIVAATNDPYGVVNLNKELGKQKGVVAYAYAVVDSSAERPIQIRAGSPNAVKIFLNGKEVYHRDEYHHGADVDQHIAAAKLQAGRNEILVKICQNEQSEDWAQEWKFQVRLCDAVGAAVPFKERGRQGDKERGRQGEGETRRRNDRSATSSIRSSLLVSPSPCLPFSLSPLLLVCAAGGEWPQFRGSEGRAVADEESGLPVKWSRTENVRWKAELPGRGVSSAVVAGGRVYVTAASMYRDRRLHVLCFDAATGRKMWERQLAATGSTMCHPKTSMAAPTPVADATRVFALFASGDVAAFDRDGDLLWYRALLRDYPDISNQVGMAASPVLVGETLLLPLENAGDSFALAVDAQTGRNRWKTPRRREINWVTPTVARFHGQTAVLFQTSAEITAYNPDDGKVLWSYKSANLGSVPSPLVMDDLVIVPGTPTVALRVSEGGKPEVVWKSRKLAAAYASPLAYRGRIYALTGIGVACFDPANGQEIWRERLGHGFSASPVVADGKLYVAKEEGDTSVVQLGDKPKILANNALNEPLLATPAIANGAIYLRTEKHLYCIGARTK